MAAQVDDQELVIHVFFPLEGPQAETAYRQMLGLWSACRDRLGMTEPIRGIPAPASPPQEPGALPQDEDGAVAAQQSADTNRQAVLRRMHDVLNLSVALAQPVPRESTEVPPGRPRGWAEWAQVWSQASAVAADAALGEVRLLLARAVGATGTVAATPELGESLEPLLPYREDRPREWWRWGTTTGSGFAVWDTSPGDTGRVREIVTIAASDRGDELSAWAWSDGTVDLPPFARYLLHAAKLRYEARLLGAWGRTRDLGDIGGMLAELSVVLAPETPHRDKLPLLRSRLSRLRAEEIRLEALQGDLRRLGTTVSIARDNLGAPVRSGPGTTDMFTADQDLARWLTLQLEDYLGYLRADLDQTRGARELAGQELEQAVAAEGAPAPAGLGAAGTAGEDEARRRVFVIHGRDTVLQGRFFDLLRAVNLRPLEWEALVRATGSAMPSLAKVVAGAPHLAQATLVLLSPDDIVELHPDLAEDGDPPHERARMGQARPNVLFELGLALMAYPDSTIIVEAGHVRPLSDLAGLNVVRFDGSAVAIKKVLSRLEMAGCPVDCSDVDWLDPRRFAGLAAYRRGPGTSGTAR